MRLRVPVRSCARSYESTAAPRQAVHRVPSPPRRPTSCAPSRSGPRRQRGAGRWVRRSRAAGVRAQADGLCHDAVCDRGLCAQAIPSALVHSRPPLQLLAQIDGCGCDSGLQFVCGVVYKEGQVRASLASAPHPHPHPVCLGAWPRVDAASRARAHGRPHRLAWPCPCWPRVRRRRACTTWSARRAPCACSRRHM